MHALRIPIAALAGALFTSSMFWLLWSLIETSFDVGDRAEAARIEFSRMRRDTEVATKRDEKVERDQYLYRERRYGTFHRQVELPVRVQGDATTATFEDGVLTLRIPKAEEVKPRQIKVKPAMKQVESSTDGNSNA